MPFDPGALVVVICALAQGLTISARARLCAELGVSPRTLDRWRHWWGEMFPATAWRRGAESAGSRAG